MTNRFLFTTHTLHAFPCSCSSNLNTTRFRPRTTWNTSLPHLTRLSISHYHHLLSRQPIDHRPDHRLPISIVQRHRASIMRAARVPTTRPRVCQVVPIPMKSNHSSAYSMLPARCTRRTIISSTLLNYKSNSFVSACVCVASPSTMMGMIHHPVSISTIISMVKSAMANSDASPSEIDRYQVNRKRSSLMSHSVRMTTNSSYISSD